MRKLLLGFIALGMAVSAANLAHAVILIGGSINNGNLDLTYAQEINPPAPGFFLPKPQVWQNEGIRGGGPWEDELSSEPWAGPAPTPVTTDGLLNPPHPEGCGGPDCGVFFKPFGGNPNNPVTGHLYQDHPGTPGMKYILTGWAGGEANFLARGAEIAIDFMDNLGNPIGGSAVDLMPTLVTPNGQPFNYKQYMTMAIAPPGTATVRARVSMIEGIANPAGGGQAFVVDDFTLECIPEPASIALGLLGLLGMAGLIGRRR